MPESALEIDDVTAGYGSAVVLQGVSVSVKANSSLAVLGRNGVGKTTLLLTVMGVTRMTSGAIRLGGGDLTRMKPHARVRKGLGWVPQERGIFPSLSVEENLLVAGRRGPWDVAAVYKLFPRLAERRNNMGNQLSGGEQQMLAVARALMTNPKVLLLDEPFEGLAPVIVEELAAAIKLMGKDKSTALVLVEQNLQLALSLTDDAIILERGNVAHRAASDDLLKDTGTLQRFIGLDLAGEAGAGRQSLHNG